MMPKKKKEKIKHFLGCIPAFLNDPINFCFDMEALSARSRRFFGSTRLQKSTHVARLAATESRDTCF